MKPEIAKVCCASCIVVTLLASCGDKGRGTADERGPRPEIPRTAIRSTKTLRQWFAPGLATNAIVRKLGKPDWVLGEGDAEQMWAYAVPAFPADDEMRGSLVDGFVLTITNGRLAFLGCSYTGSFESGPAERVMPGDKGSGPSGGVKLFLVSTNPVAGGRFVDTERLPKLGFVGPTPDLTISKVRDVTVAERKWPRGAADASTVWSFGVSLVPEDATRLKSLTSANVSKQLLIMVGNEPVCAPTIKTGLDGGSFSIECDEPALMERVKRQLASMERVSR